MLSITYAHTADDVVSDDQIITDDESVLENTLDKEEEENALDSDTSFKTDELSVVKDQVIDDLIESLILKREMEVSNDAWHLGRPHYGSWRMAPKKYRGGWAGWRMGGRHNYKRPMKKAGRYYYGKKQHFGKRWVGGKRHGGWRKGHYCGKRRY